MSVNVVMVRVFVLMLLCGIALVVWFPTVSFVGAATNVLTVRFLDVGQGDSIHIITPDGYELMIDGGPSAVVLRELAKGQSFFDREIDVVIATHPDTDHVAGLVDVLERYHIGMLIETAVEHDAPAAVMYREAAQLEGARLITAQAGQTIQLGASTTIRILSPLGDTTDWRSNTASIIVQVVYGDTKFMFTGDAPDSIEEYLVGVYGELLESEVLKLGHHGSDTSSSGLFLNTVKPEYTVVSAGKDNRYGHPHKEVLTRVSEVGSEVISTAKEGTVTFLSDGDVVWQK